MIVAQRFTVSCSVASATPNARQDVARIKNNFFIEYSSPGYAYRNECILTQFNARSFAVEHGHYSVRSAVIGFTRVARFAGKKQARSAALANRATRVNPITA